MSTEIYYLSDAIGPLPAVGDPERARHGLQDWHGAAQRAGDDTAERAAAIAGSDQGARLLGAIFGNSPFLTHCAVRDPRFSCVLFERGPDATIEVLRRDLVDSARAGAPLADLARLLRVAKRRVALCAAVADIAGTWDVDRVTGVLSAFAEKALSLAAARLLKDNAEAGRLVLPYPDEPERGSGLVILGMGKLGSKELNYSSDIDIIVLYDPEVIETPDPDTLQQTFVRLARNLVKTMEERTADGYVFRTDLRLRPDPGSTPLAMSVMAAELYYESIGQNWERAAMIKARPVAGDREAGARFIGGLRPFIWRKSLDFAAINDVHSIKRQINAHRGGSAIAVGGHNVKLGRGGIREIEFFAQTQQLIWGGREPSLRIAPTCAALFALAEVGRIETDVADELCQSYRFLRRVEHRLQMVDDAQTHTLPDDDAGLDAIAVFLGFADRDAFAEALLSHLRRVESHYAHLFEEPPDLVVDDTAGNLVFTGSDIDPETVKTLERLGYSNPTAVDSTVRGWHHGRYRCTRAARAREILTELMPGLLSAFARTPDPDAALLKFDEFLSRLPAGVHLFSMFYSNPHLLDLLAEIMGGAPRLAALLSRAPALLEGVLTQDFFTPPPPSVELDEELDRQLAQARDFQDVLDISRRWANERKFQVGVQTLRSIIDAETSGEAYSDIAETAVSRLLPRIEAEFAATHGRFADAGMAVVALGKLGSREMTATSDLDLIFIYDADDAEGGSDGPRPLAAAQYFARLSQRLINAISAPTAEGTLFEVDMRLRPSGNAGPIASSLASFIRYHEESAWTWEHMALTRARVIAGPPPLRDKVRDVIRAVLTRPRDPEGLRANVADMRARMDREHHTDSLWEVKHVRGGLVDIDFLAQYLVLRHAPQEPSVMGYSTAQVLRRLVDAGFLDTETGSRLGDALHLWQTVQAILRVTLEGELSGDTAGHLPRGLTRALLDATGCADLATLETRMEVTAAQVYGVFKRVIDSRAGGEGSDGVPDGRTS